MSIAKYALAESAIGQSEAPVVRTKTPPTRQTIALADTTATPEPR